MQGELIENRIIIWDIVKSKELFSESYYGKPIGMAKPKPEEIDVPLILDLIEGYYLLEKNVMQIHKTKKKITRQQLLEICRQEYHNFDKKYLVYKDFRDKNYIVNPGIK